MIKLSAQNGFTLIEITIVFSILAILSVTGIAAFLNYSRTQTLITASSDVSTVLNTAKSRAMSQKIIDPNDETKTLCEPNSFLGYRMLICKFNDGTAGSVDCINATNNNSYQLQVLCSNNYKLPLETKTLPTNISFPSGAGTSVSFLFQALTGGVDIVGGANPGVIRINGYGSDYRIINVFTDGRIVAN